MSRCDRCSSLELGIITELRSSNEYNKSKAIAEAIDFLVKRINTNTEEHELVIKKYEDKINELNIKISESNKNMNDYINSLESMKQKLLHNEKLLSFSETNSKKFEEMYEKSRNDIEKMSREYENSIRQFKEKIDVIEKNHKDEIGKAKEREMNILKKIKESEIKICRNNLDYMISDEMKLTNKSFYKSSDTNNMNIEDIISEIRNVESSIKCYTEELNNPDTHKNENRVQELMDFLDNKSQYLLDLKKTYNYLFKKLII